MKPIYTLPEAFINDESVPAKWRLYGMINGFWVNGLTVYAGNTYFATKLNCSERNVRMALEELEVLGLVRREIAGHSREIFPGGSGASGEAEVGVPPRRKPGFHPMHSSIASNKKAEVDSEIDSDSSSEEEDVSYVESDEDGNEIVRKKKKTNRERKDKTAQRLQHAFSEKAKVALGVGIQTTIGGYLRILEAMKTPLTEEQIISLFDDWFDSNKPSEDLASLSACLSTNQINRFKVRYGI